MEGASQAAWACLPARVRSPTVSFWHFLHTQVLDVMGRQPFQEHFLLLGKFDDGALLAVEGRDQFKDPIRKPLRAVLSVDPVVVGLQRRYVRLVG